MATPKQTHFLWSMTGRDWWPKRLSVETASHVIDLAKTGCDARKANPDRDVADRLEDVQAGADAVREYFPDFENQDLRYRWRRRKGQEQAPSKPQTSPKKAADKPSKAKAPKPKPKAADKPQDKPHAPIITKPKPKATGLAGQIEALIAAGLENILIVGPAGCGKTTCARLAAEALGRDLTMIPCSLGTPAFVFTGRRHPISGEYEETEFTKAYAAGHVILLDEVDSLDPAVACAMNAALANGHLATPKGMIARHPETVIVATANTCGNGASRQYVGRNQLDAATLDRFAGARIQATYSQEYESQYDKAVVTYCYQVREHIETRQLRRIVSTRMIQGCAKLKAAGLDWQGQVTADWSESEKQGVAA